MKNKIYDAVKKQFDEQEEIIRQAFERHFGFPIENADKTKLDMVSNLWSTTEQYRYNNETFLLWENNLVTEVTSGVNFSKLTITSQYLMV